jgi:hypothetical protein
VAYRIQTPRGPATYSLESDRWTGDEPDLVEALNTLYTFGAYVAKGERMNVWLMVSLAAETFQGTVEDNTPAPRPGVMY